MAKFSPPLDQNLLLKMAAKVKQQQALTKTYGNRYLSMAVLSELSALTPENIRLLSFKATFPTAPPASPSGAKVTKDAAKPQETAKPKTETVIVEGLVSGDPKNQEADLASYVVKIDSSPLFEKTAIQKSLTETFKRGQVLYFIITAQLEAG